MIVPENSISFFFKKSGNYGVGAFAGYLKIVKEKGFVVVRSSNVGK